MIRYSPNRFLFFLLLYFSAHRILISKLLLHLIVTSLHTQHFIRSTVRANVTPQLLDKFLSYTICSTRIFLYCFFPTFFFKFYKIILVTSRTRKSFYFLLNYFIYSDISELQEKLSSHQKLLLKLYTIFHSSLFFYISQMCSFFLQQNVQSLFFSDTFSLFF